MAFIRTIVPVICVALFVAVSGAAPPPRPDTGIGVLLVGAVPGEPAPPQLILYGEPGIGRIAEKSAASLPHLAIPHKIPPGEFPLVVTARKGGWLKVIYDDAGRAAWLKPRRAWPFVLWDELLKGREARLLRGLKKPLYLLWGSGGDTVPDLEPLTPERSFRIISVDGDRIQVLLDLAVVGWLRWRDEDGRLLIALE
ncbi:hypothetical protein GeomeDRAFT_1170 [Geobacter metallireducens RCH3]|uniref:Uncharacterized protein n=1 Tax=Geobacter metallireducens (strain ATCC 53774 / DSM 7210 / GS-15) TaxID=269799 RepID=Q39QD5_GEOMG|nr:hypothetical protein [Geobacter metallireducens]ABB33539.1 hypothetical protein Gmet_3326 [Geobacter metallireducens GS-15]EHP87646.1 hypothetical protein GeomeDRAFT_1170 [Geobacter metallireducens RCH3]